MHRFRTLLLATSVLIPLGLIPAAANPLGPQVVGGSATVQGQGTATVTVTQQSNSAIINWNTFNIGAGEKTNIVMPSSNSVELNRVTGNLGPSQIYGSLWSNGRVFLVNPDGILFGSGAVVDTAGFLATTHDIANADFMAGRYNFSIPGNPGASIVNQGTITAQSGGFAALVAPGVRNSGTITATLGTVALASGNSFTLDFYGDKLITLGINDSIAAQVKDIATGQPLNSLVTNEGKLSANGGRVELTAAAARTVVDSVINNTGVIEANSIGSKNGMIVLGAATASSKPAGTPTQTVKVSGTLAAAGKAAGTKGGKIQITGENIAVTGASIDASGVAGGGKVLIGGDVGGGHPNPLLASMAQAQLEADPVPTSTTVSIDAATTINASATGSGDGGKVVVWADDTTSYRGDILARGGDVAGNGGFVEVSGHGMLNFYGTTDTSAAAGVSGLTLLDPTNFTINSDNVGSILSSLASGNILISTVGTTGTEPGDIFVNAAMTWSSASALTLQSAHDISINSAITATQGGLILNAVNGISATGAINLANFTLQNGAWTQIATSLPGFVAQDFRVTGGTFLRALGGSGSSPSPYQIADIYGLEGINSPSNALLNQHFVLANNIDATVTVNWNGGTGFVPIGEFGGFTGQLDGQNFTISNLKVAPTAAGLNAIGLFGRIGAGGVVQSLNLTNVDIHANPNLGTGFQNVGALAGLNFGLIDHVTASGTINGGSVTGLYVGGLVGQNGFIGTAVTSGTVQNSSAAVNVTLGDGVACTGQPCTNARINTAGGLVGHNIATITNSSASGAVVVGANAQAGGLVGLLGFVGPNQTSPGALIASSFATGNVSSAGVNVALGGLVGSSAPTAIITLSYATGNVTATAPLALAPSGVDCSIAGNCEYENVGGLVGQNSGTIQGAAVIPLLNQPCVAGQTCATGAVSVGSNAHAGGLVGNNTGIIANAFATGTVTGAAGLSNLVFLVPNYNTTRLGGLVSINQGLITGSHATGDVGTLNVANLHAGGLAAGGNGAIVNSYATGNVSAGDTSLVGGLVSLNPTNIVCGGCVGSDGYAYFNTALISNSYATGNVTAGAGGVASGLAALNFGTITGSWASGNVVVGGNSSAGGLVGVNNGSVSQSYATGAVSGSGSFDDLGGLVGWNLGSVSQSYATGAVSSASVNVSLGGLVGSNAPGATITSSYATGNVTATAAIASNFGVDCSAPNSNCQHASVGGLVGQNNGTIQGAAVPPLLTQPCAAGQTCATGAVSVGSHASGGGLVGFNDGIIVNAFATGAVTGAAGLGSEHGATNLGGLAAANIGLITGSFATGDVGTLGFANLQVGGLVGDNGGKIDHSFATGNVRAGDNSYAGGLTSDNSTGFFPCSGCTPGDGHAYFNAGLTSNSYATGNVTVGAASLAGGLTGSNDGTLNNTYATGAVSGGGNSILGGLVGVTDLAATITNSLASGAVSSTGPNSWVGGFIGGNGGAISLSSASGPVTGTSDSLIGGFVGYNLGAIKDSTASGTVTGTGANNFDGGFVGVNLGFIDPSTAAGAVTGGTNNVVGGFAGANASFINVPAALVIPGSTFPVGTVSADSHATGVATGGANSTVGGQIGTSYPTALPASPSVIAGCDTGVLCSILHTSLTLAPPPAPAPTPLPVPDTQIAQIIPPVNNDVTTPAPILASLTPPSSPAGSPPAAAGATANATPGKPGFIPPPLPLRSVPGPNGETRSSVPPPGETRFFNNHVLLQLDLNIPDVELTRITQQLGLRITASDTMTTLGRKLIRLALPPGLSVRNAIRQLEANRLVSVAAPDYQFRLVQVAAAISKGDPAQYMLGNLHLDKAHAIASGKGVTIAVIDSEIDKGHTELQGAIPEELDTLDVKEPPHSHGTAMAGAIVSHDRLLGVAPGATILAVRAFGKSNNTAEGTTLSILKGIEWAVSQGARVINMSFAGPRDPSLERALKAAHEKGVVLVAAAGNAGPKSPPLYPGADPSVIAVTATDIHDRMFRGANQGPQLSVAAPGVEILAPAPGETYEMSTGTSIATAHVSGVVALMLERDPTLKPDEVREILESTATDLGPKGKDNQFGWGLVNPQKALEAIAARQKSSGASSKSR